MRFSSSALLGWCSVVVVLGTGCASTTPSSTLPEHEASAPTSSLLVPEAVPTPRVRTAGVAAQGSLVLQVGLDESLVSAEFSPDGERVLVASYTGVVSVRDFATGASRAVRRMWVSPARGGLASARLDATGTRVLMRGSGPPYDDQLFVWDLLTDTLVSGFPQGSGELRAAGFTSDGSLVAALGTAVLEVRDAGTLVSRPPTLLRDPRGQPYLANHVWLSPSNARFIAARDVEFDYYDTRHRLLQNPIRSALLYDGGGALVSELVVDPDEARAAQREDEEELALGFRLLEFRPGGGMLATLSSHGEVQLRHPETGAVLHTIEVPIGAGDADWTREGERLLVRHAADEQLVLVVDPATGEVVAEVHTQEGAWPFTSARLANGETVIFSLNRRDAFSVSGEARPHPLDAFVSGDAAPSDMRMLAVTPSAHRAVLQYEGALHFVDLLRGAEVARQPTSQGPASVWGALFVPSRGVVMTMRESGVLIRPSAPPQQVPCAVAGARLDGPANAPRLVGPNGVCGLGDAGTVERPDIFAGSTGELFAISTDQSVRVLGRSDEVVVEEVATQRVRMRVPAGDRVIPSCEGCPPQYSLSPDGSLLVVHESSLPVALFDTRTGRRVARLTSPGRSPHWVEWSPSGNAFAVHWTRTYDPQADPQASVPSIISVYDSRGRVVVSVEGAPDEDSGDDGAAFSPTHAVAYVGHRVQVAEIARRRASTLEVSGGVAGAEWHGTALRLVVQTDDGSVQALYAPGATTPYFQHEGPGTFTGDARWVFRCREGELERLRVEDLARTVFGSCILTTLFPSPDGRFVALPRGDHLRVVREDATSLRLGVLRDDAAGLVAFAIDEATGRFTTFGAAQPDAVLRYRLAGSAMIAPLVTLGEAASQQDPQLLERFLAPAAP